MPCLPLRIPDSAVADHSPPALADVYRISLFGFNLALLSESRMLFPSHVEIIAGFHLD
jgi:hypothetical protein